MTTMERLPTQREVIEAEMQAIWNDRGRLVPEEVVDLARDPDHVLHSYMEWDDKVGAENFRILQAASMIRSVKVRITALDGTGNTKDYSVRAWTAARSLGPGDQAGYVPTERALADPATAAALRRQMQRDAAAFRRRYEHLDDYADTVAALA